MGLTLLVGVTDSDWFDDPDDQNFTIDCIFNISFRPITQDCKKQQSLSLSSTEGEY